MLKNVNILFGILLNILLKKKRRLKKNHLMNHGLP